MIHITPHLVSELDRLGINFLHEAIALRLQWSAANLHRDALNAEVDRLAVIAAHLLRLRHGH